MKEFIAYLVSLIAEDPKTIEVEEIIGEYGETRVQIKSPKEQMGLLIGKKGRIVQSLRSLLKILAVKKGVRLELDIIEKP